jgi:hypothetical protein
VLLYPASDIRLPTSGYAQIAQSVEQWTENPRVAGSIPALGTNRIVYGRVPEWPKGADCKSVVTDFDGSNPSPPTKKG